MKYGKHDKFLFCPKCHQFIKRFRFNTHMDKCKGIISCVIDYKDGKIDTIYHHRYCRHSRIVDLKNKTANHVFKALNRAEINKIMYKTRARQSHTRIRASQAQTKTRKDAHTKLS